MRPFKWCLIALLAVALALPAASCAQAQDGHILGFAQDEISKIELYLFSAPAKAQKMILVEEPHIKKAYNAITNTTLCSGAATDENAETGGEKLSFRFHLIDGSSYCIAYHCSTLETMDKSYPIESSAIEGLWEALDLEVSDAAEGELPVTSA